MVEIKIDKGILTVQELKQIIGDYIKKNKCSEKIDISEKNDFLSVKWIESNRNNDILEYDFIECKHKKININNIMYIENDLHKVFFHVIEKGIEKKYSMYKNMNDLEKKFDSSHFLRIHQSYLVNMKYIYDVKRYIVRLKNGEGLPVSKKKYKCTIDRITEV